MHEQYKPFIPTKQDLIDDALAEKLKEKTDSPVRVRSLIRSLISYLRADCFPYHCRGLYKHQFISEYDVEPLKELFADKGWELIYDTKEQTINIVEKL